jgi:hypothetical protein
MLKDEGHDEINDNRAPEGKKGKIDKVHPYRSGFYSKLVAPPLANAKGALLKPFADPVYHFEE